MILFQDKETIKNSSLKRRILTSIRSNAKNASLIAPILHGVRTVFGIVILFAIPHFTDPTTQGVWYLFVSLGALSSLAEMGFAGLFIVFSSHVKTKNESCLGQNVNLSTEAKSKEIPSFAKFALLWASSISIGLFPILSAIGGVIIMTRTHEQHWALPWLFFVLALSLNLFSTFITAWHEGSKGVISAFAIRTLSTVANVTCTTLALYGGAGLWALPLGAFIGGVIPVAIIVPSLLMTSRGTPESVSLNFKVWYPQIAPLLKKNAASFLGGYIVFQSPVIVTYLVLGSEKSGQVGFALNAWMAAFGVFYTILGANAAPAGKLWANGAGNAAWQLCLRSLFRASGLFLISGAGALLAFIFFPDFFPFLSRMSSIRHMLVFALGLLLHLGVVAVAIFCRSSKSEPFAKISLITAALCIPTTFLAVKLQYSPFWGFTLANVITIFYCIKILKSYGIQMQAAN